MIRTALHPVTILLATMSLQWVALAEAGAFTILLPYLTLALVAAFAPLSPRRFEAGIEYVKRNALWLGPLTVFFVIVWPILAGSPAANTTPRQVFYLVACIGLAAFASTSRTLPKIFRVGGLLGLLIFVGFTELLASRIGLSWVDAITRFVVNGDLKFVFYSFFTAIFNSLSPFADAGISASRKNDVAGCVLVLLLLFRAGSKRPERDLAGIAFTGASLLLLVMLNDRSILLIAGGSLLIAAVLGSRVRSVENIPALILKITVVLILLILAMGSMPSEGGFWSALQDRFSFNDHSTEARLAQYHIALERIEDHPFLGSGYSEVGGYAIHNVFLSAWMYAGLPALICVVAFYLVVVLRWLLFMFNVATKPGYWVLPLGPEWLAPLALAPIFRVWISGEGGVLKFAEWIALTIFFSCLLGNSLLHKRLKQHQANAGVMRTPGMERTPSSQTESRSFGDPRPRFSPARKRRSYPGPKYR